MVGVNIIGCGGSRIGAINNGNGQRRAGVPYFRNPDIFTQRLAGAVGLDNDNLLARLRHDTPQVMDGVHCAVSAGAKIGERADDKLAAARPAGGGQAKCR